MKPSPMSKWASNNQKMSSDHLLQNCDLPPPSKVFSGSGNKTVLSSMMKMDPEVILDYSYSNYELSDEKLELLKALRLSQTRAREAEKKVESLVKERDCLVNVFLGDSSKLFAYRQWLRLLEVQVSVLQAHCHSQEQQHNEHIYRDDCEEEEDGVGISWFVAFALCLGFASVGFALGCKYLL